MSQIMDLLNLAPDIQEALLFLPLVSNHRPKWITAAAASRRTARNTATAAEDDDGSIRRTLDRSSPASTATAMRLKPQPALLHRLIVPASRAGCTF